MNTLKIWDTAYPIMSPLGNGWFLIAHPNGPAIATTEGQKYLGHLATMSDVTDDVPNEIRWKAVDELMMWAVKQPNYPRL